MNKSLFIGYCHRGMVHQRFAQSLVNFTLEDFQGRRCLRDMTAVDGLYVYENRNLIVQTFLEQSKAEWLLFIDTDVGFAAEQVYALLDHADAEHQIVAGLYFTWIAVEKLGGAMPGSALTPCWFESVTTPLVPVRTIDMGKLQEVAVCGMGFTLLGRSALIKIRDLHKEDPAHWFAHDVLACGPEKQLQRVGEDVTFCVRAKNAGITTWGLGVVVDHIKTHSENLDTFLQLRK